MGVSEPLKQPIYDSGRQLCSVYEKQVISLPSVWSWFVILPYIHLEVKYLKLSFLKCGVWKETYFEIGKFQPDRVKEVLVVGDLWDVSSAASCLGQTLVSTGSAQPWLCWSESRKPSKTGLAPALQVTCSSTAVRTSLSLLMGSASQNLNLSWSQWVETICLNSL